MRGEKINTISADDLTEKIMGKCQDFVNNELIDRIKTLGASNCHIVTHGVNEYQIEKINRTGIKSFFSNIYVVQDTKKDSVELICKKFKKDTVVFVDDKEERFADLDFKKHSNLRTVLYVGQESIEEIFDKEL